MMKKLLIIAGLLTGAGLSAAEPAIAAAANAAKIATETVLKNPMTIQAAVQKVVTVCKQTLTICGATAVGALGTWLSVAPKDIAEGATDAATNAIQKVTDTVIKEAPKVVPSAVDLLTHMTQEQFDSLTKDEQLNLLLPAFNTTYVTLIATKKAAKEAAEKTAALIAATDKKNLYILCAAGVIAYIGVTTALEQYFTNRRIKDKITRLPANQLNQISIQQIHDADNSFYFNIPLNPLRWFQLINR